MLGHNRPASETPFQWQNRYRADNSPLSRQTFLDPRMTFWEKFLLQYNGTFDIPTYKYQLKKWPTQSLYKLLLSWARATLVYARQTYIHQCRQASQDLLEPKLHRWSKIPTTFFLCIQPFGTFWHWNESGKMVCDRQKHRQTGKGMVEWFYQPSCSPSYLSGLNCKTPSAVYYGRDYRYTRSLSVRSSVCPL